ncbi:hypothetical protein [Peribacillus loiseleuriae]|uniref:hypothetical protein n=1 Tax=Peribacillus loiseleuriae TaxID=1679170 RepID=UPI003D01DA99
MLMQHEAVVTIDDQKTVVNIEKFQIPPDQLFNDVYFGNIVSFDVIDNYTFG